MTGIEGGNLPCYWSMDSPVTIPLVGGFSSNGSSSSSSSSSSGSSSSVVGAGDEAAMLTESSLALPSHPSVLTPSRRAAAPPLVSSVRSLS